MLGHLYKTHGFKVDFINPDNFQLRTNRKKLDAEILKENKERKRKATLQNLGVKVDVPVNVDTTCEYEYTTRKESCKRKTGGRRYCKYHMEEMDELNLATNIMVMDPFNSYLGIRYDENGITETEVYAKLGFGMGELICYYDYAKHLEPMVGELVRHEPATDIQELKWSACLKTHDCFNPVVELSLEGMGRHTSVGRDNYQRHPTPNSC